MTNQVLFFCGSEPTVFAIIQEAAHLDMYLGTNLINRKLSYSYCLAWRCEGGSGRYEKKAGRVINNERANWKLQWKIESSDWKPS